ncbi:hypothetical protein DPEC_G00037310 [Dallia pectoralis]|uniref:Uncharacterized protein n=1 Tax=Dallia pectoralis TaxID=75939 RepID=A0ACC2HER5_DALPE|nr:hypothetical protein DPEC_G00037310 [Dallia pectoralis]
MATTSATGDMKNRGSVGGVDSRLKQRVEQYLSNHSGQYVDIMSMAHDLQKLYRMDYGRRNKTAFKIQVEKVHGLICEESGLTDLENKHLAKRARHNQKDAGDGFSDSNDTTDSDEDLPEQPPINLMNSSLMSLYKKGIPESGNSPRRDESASDSPVPAQSTPLNPGTKRSQPLLQTINDQMSQCWNLRKRTKELN